MKDDGWPNAGIILAILGVTAPIWAPVAVVLIMIVLSNFRLIHRAHHRTCGEVVASVWQHLCGATEANVAPVHALLLFRVVLALD